MIQLNHGHVRTEAQAFAERRLGEQQAQVGIFPHRGQPLGGIVRVKRQIGSARLENPQQSDHQFKRTLHTDADQHLWPDPLCNERMRQLVRSLVQLTIAKALRFIDDGKGIRCSFHLGLKQLVEAHFRRVVSSRSIPGDQQLLPFSRAHHGQKRNGLIRVGDDPGQQRLVVVGHPLNGGPFKKLAAIVPHCRQFIAPLPNREGQIELSDRVLNLERAERKLAQGQGFLAMVLEHKQHLKERAIGQVALRLERLDHQFKGQRLVLIGIQRDLAAPRQQFAEGGVSG